MRALRSRHAPSVTTALQVRGSNLLSTIACLLILPACGRHGKGGPAEETSTLPLPPQALTLLMQSQLPGLQKTAAGELTPLLASPSADNKGWFS